MKLTKTDKNRIDRLTNKDVWKIEAKASEYAQFYKLRYLEVLKEKLNHRIKSEREFYERNFKTE
jgi:hypothetical protein